MNRSEACTPNMNRLDDCILCSPILKTLFRFLTLPFTFCIPYPIPSSLKIKYLNTKKKKIIVFLTREGRQPSISEALTMLTAQSIVAPLATFISQAGHRLSWGGG